MSDEIQTEQNEAPIHTDSHVPMPSWAGPALGIGIILVALLIGGLYLWGSMLAPEDLEPLPPERINNEPETTRANADVQILDTMSSSDEITTIEADLGSTQLESLDTELEAMESELSEFEKKLEQ